MSSPLRASVRAIFPRWTERFEGRIDFLYVDVKGLVTIGAGALVDPVELALSLRLRWPDGGLASADQIRAEWERIKTTPGLARKGASAAGKVAQLRLSPDDLDALTDARLAATVRDLVRRFPGFTSWPADTQLAVLSMGWALGSGFEGTHPRCAAALRAGAWLTAARESAIRDNEPRTLAQRRLFLAGLRVLDDQLDPEQLTPASVTLEQLEARYLSGPPAGAVEGPVPGASEAVAIGWQAGVTAERNPER